MKYLIQIPNFFKKFKKALGTNEYINFLPFEVLID